MNAVSQIHRLVENEGGIKPPVQLYGGQVKDLITKFFYRDNHLCFHILLLTEEGGTIFFKEFTDYTAYKKALDELQKARLSGENIVVPKKNLKTATKFEKMA